MSDAPLDPSVPPDWDRIEADRPEAEEGPLPVEGRVTTLALVAAAWADLVSILAVCAAALLATTALGHPTPPASFPWAAMLGLSWWCPAAAALLATRRATPGMLVAGVALADRPARGRLAATVLVALAQAATVGLPALLGPRHTPLRLAARRELCLLDPNRC